MKQIYLFILISIYSIVGLYAQNSPYVSQIIEYKPAPGQFINTTTWGVPSCAQSVIGGITGHVSLGAFGGYIIVGFDHSIMNDPNNPYGVDFTIFGNAFTGWAEPGIVQVMKDVNGNGLADDTWYELKGSDYSLSTTWTNYSIVYANPGGYANVPWRDNRNRTGAVLINVYHTQPYYPSAANFPNVNQTSETYSGTMIAGNINDSNPTYIQSFALGYGYADNYPKQSGDPVTQPDNPSTIGTIEGAGGDAMKIEWAIDAQGNPVTLDKIDFVKIYTGLNRMCGWLGKVSTEICGIVDVAPAGGQQSISLLSSKNSSENNTGKKLVTVFPSFENIKTSEVSGEYAIFNIRGKEVLKVNDIKSADFTMLENGIYLAKPISGKNTRTFKITIEQ